jgi:hypothetical protein
MFVRCGRSNAVGRIVSRTTSRSFRGGGGFITEYANRHNTLIVILYGKLLAITSFERNIRKDSLKNAYLA